MVNGRSPKPRGGMMFSAILFLSLVTLLMYFVLNDYYLNGTFNKRTEELYQAKLMKELFLHDHFKKLPEERSDSGTVNFNTGRIKYYFRGADLVVSVFTAERVFGFEIHPAELQQLETQETTVDSSTDDSIVNDSRDQK